MPTFEETMTALRNADKSGNRKDAIRLSQIADSLRPFGLQEQEGARGFSPFFSRGVTSMAGLPMNIAEAGINKITGKNIELPGTTSGIESGIKGIPREIGDTLGAPVDIITSGLNLIPGVNIKNPPGGSESIRKMLEPLMPVFPEKDAMTETIAEHTGQVMGESTAMLLPQTAAIKALSAGKSLISKIAIDMNKALLRQPVLMLASEETAAAGAGLGRGLVEENKIENPIARMGIEMAAGMIGGLAPVAAFNTPTVLAMKHGKPILQKVLLPFTEEGKRVRAGEGIKGELSASGSIVKSRIDTQTLTPLPPAIRSGEERIISMYKTLLAKNPVKEAEEIEKLVKNIVDLEGKMRKLGYGSTDLVIDATRHRVAALETDMDKRIIDSLNKAKKRVSVIPKARRESIEARIVNDELRKTKSIANNKVIALWNEVSDDIPVGRESTLSKYDEILKRLSSDQRKANIPSVLKTSKITKVQEVEEFYKTLDIHGQQIPKESVEKLTIKDMKGLRSLLLEGARIDAKDLKHSRAKIANEMADAILEDMGIVANTANTPEAAKLQAALIATRKFRQKYESGIIGKILGIERTGVPAVDPVITLERSVGRQGVSGSVDVKKLIVSQKARKATERYLGRSFSDYTINKDTGEFSTLKAKNFIETNEDILDLFPDLKKQLSDASSAHDYAKQIKAVMEARKAAIRDPKISQAARLLNAADIEGEIDLVIKSGNPAREAAELMRKAERAGGVAKHGVRGGFVKWILDNSYVGQYNELGEQTLSGSTLLANIRIHENIFNKVFTLKQINRMKKIGKELAQIEKFGKISLTKDEIIKLNDTTTNVLRQMSRVVGARIGGKLGKESAGGSLQMAQITSGNFQKLINWISSHSAEEMVYEAILSDDSTLLKTLIMPIEKPTIKSAKPPNLDLIIRRMNAWLASSGKRIMEDIEREDSQ